MPTRSLIIALVWLLLLCPSAGAEESWQWPLRGEVITGFHNGDDPYAAGQHRGVDIAGPEGAEVVAAVGGAVRFAGPLGSSGVTVSVRSTDGRFDTSYLHLSAVSVREGASVAAGERIGTVGTTGRRSATAPHLHFGVREAGKRHAYRDPLDFLPPLVPAPREAPRGAPAPVAVPRPVAVAPEPVWLPGLTPAPSRVRSPGRIRVPAARPLRAPEARRVPAGRRMPLPRLTPAPRPVGAPVRPLVPTPSLRQAPGGRVRSRVPAPSLAPEAGPSRVRVPAAEHADARAATSPGHAANPASGGPDIGLALACLGLLLAAACLGRPGRRGSSGGRARTSSLASLLRPLTGRR